MADSRALRSARWFGNRDLAGFIHRTSLAAEPADGRPVVGICNPWSELVHCNLHFRGLAEAVHRGIAGAGGIPVEFSTISLGENLMKPTAMLYRNLMGTASTMTSLVEALGLALPGTASIPALHPDRARAAEATGARAVGLAREGLRPSEILTDDAFVNAITLLMALGGGTNAVIHLLALAGRVGVPLTLDRFHELSARTPLLANVLPSGEHLVEDLHRAGGIAAVLGELAPLLHGDARTVTGTLADGYAAVADRTVIAPLDAPLAAEGGIAGVHGSPAPSGAIVKRSAASPALLQHRGPTIVVV